MAEILAAKYLADTSAWFWSHLVSDSWESLVLSGRIVTCPIVDLEYLFSARSSKEYLSEYSDRVDGLESVPLSSEIGQRALEIQLMLAQKSEMGHRSVGLQDVLIAACAEQAGLTVLHYDQDFDLINEVTGQPTEWLAPRGSLTA